MEYGRASNVYWVLDSTLEEILSLIKPDADDLARRSRVVRDITFLLESVSSLNGAAVNPFGSYVSNLFTKWGDVDVSIQLSQAPSSVDRRKKQMLLRDMMKAISSRGWGPVMFIPQAKVPVLVFQSRLWNISCDISVDNHWGLAKSRILRRLSLLDQRFRDMVLIIKEWAKAQNVNDPKAGTLSSYSLCLLIIFHFQTCTPAIFPPLKDIYEGRRFTSLKEVEDRCAANIARIAHMVSNNRSSLRELLLSFFLKFSRLKELAKDQFICTNSGRYEFLFSSSRWRGERNKLIIEDPFELDENAGRTVGDVGLLAVSEAFAETFRKLSSSSMLYDKNAILNILLSPRALSHRRLKS